VDKIHILKVCDVLGETGSALRLLVQSNSPNNQLWRMRSAPQQFPGINSCPPTTLHEALSAATLPGLKVKRLLAATFAYALLQCHASPCMTELFRKESIYFYQLNDSITAFESPFVLTDFQHCDQAAVNMALQHRSPPVLRLAILLLEVHKGVLFEALLTETEKADDSPNRDLTAARRIVQNLEDWCSETYKDAIRACLEMPWVGTGRLIDFDDADICGGFIEQVIKPLESELDHLFKLKL